MKSTELLAAALALAMVFSLLPLSVSGHSTETKVADIIVGGGGGTGLDVGDVFAWNDGTYLYVRYQIIDATPGDLRDDWWITQTHLAVGISPAIGGGIPQTKDGNPIPGQFMYGGAFDPWVTESPVYQIALASIGAAAGQQIFIAAHAVVQQLAGLDALEYSLPATATISVTPLYNGGPSYFPHLYVTGGFLSGDYLGWCVDTEHTIAYHPRTYIADVYSSYEGLPAGLVDHPENFDQVNWILNQHYVGTDSGTFGIFTYGDVAIAIWTLLDDDISGAGQTNPERVNLILAAAQANGVGFAPTCGQIVAVIFAPFDVYVYGSFAKQVVIGQVVMGELGIPCISASQSAWGVVFAEQDPAADGLGPVNDFNIKKTWAEYIPYAVTAV